MYQSSVLLAQSKRGFSRVNPYTAELLDIIYSLFSNEIPLKISSAVPEMRNVQTNAKNRQTKILKTIITLIFSVA